MNNVFMDSIAQLTIEKMVHDIRELENDEHVLLARKANAAREALSDRLNELQKERVRGMTLERQGLTHEYLNSILDGRE